MGLTCVVEGLPLCLGAWLFARAAAAESARFCAAAQSLAHRDSRCIKGPANSLSLSLMPGYVYCAVAACISAFLDSSGGIIYPCQPFSLDTLTGGLCMGDIYTGLSPGN